MNIIGLYVELSETKSVIELKLQKYTGGHKFGILTSISLPLKNK